MHSRRNSFAASTRAFGTHGKAKIKGMVLGLTISTSAQCLFHIQKENVFICCLLFISMAECYTETLTSFASSKGFGKERMLKTSSLESSHNERHKRLKNDKFSGLIPPEYSIHEPPPLINGKPVPIKFSVSLKNIPEINELKQILSVEMNLRIYWQDTRLMNGTEHLFEDDSSHLVHGYVSLNPVILSKIWVPDIYSDYAKSVSSQEVLRRPLSIRIYPNATIRYSARIMMELSCPMDFRMYPGDSQRCDIRFESYGYTRKEIAFSWKYEGNVVNIDHRLAHFDFDVTQVNEKGDVNFMSGSYPAIVLCLRFHRRLSYHLLQTYIPSSLFVIISWISFLVPVEYAAGRLAICMTLLLTLTAMFGAIRTITPTASYIKALDVWMVCCIIFVFLALAEFAFVLRLDKIVKLEKISKKVPSSETSNEGWGPQDGEEKELKSKAWSKAETGHDHDFSRSSHQPSLRKKIIKMNIQSDGLVILRRRLEFISACLSPIIFVFFNAMYWSWLLLPSSSSVNCE